MDAGRETNRAVAERVFGKQTRLMHAYRDPECGDWSVCPFCEMAEHGDPDVIACYRDKDHEQEPCYAIPGPGTDVYWAVVPFYSQDIAAAWTVLERLADLGHVIHVKADGQRPKDRRYTIIDAALGGRVGPDEGSAPLAICRAALAAVGAGAETPFTGTPGHPATHAELAAAFRQRTASPAEPEGSFPIID